MPSSPSQLEELKQQLELQEEELGRLRLGVVRRPVGSRRGGERPLTLRGVSRVSLSARGRQTQRRGSSI